MSFIIQKSWIGDNVNDYDFHILLYKVFKTTSKELDMSLNLWVIVQQSINGFFCKIMGITFGLISHLSNIKKWSYV